MYPYGPPPSARQEVQIFNANGVTVTTARFIVSQQTYPIGAITSVGPFTIPAKRGGYVLAALFALVALIGFANGAGSISVIMVMMGLAAGGYAAAQKTIHGVMIATSGMQVRALTSPDLQFVSAVLGALNQAIAMR